LNPFTGHIEGGGVVGQKLVKIFGKNGTAERREKLIRTHQMLFIVAQPNNFNALVVA